MKRVEITNDIYFLGGGGYRDHPMLDWMESNIGGIDLGMSSGGYGLKYYGYVTGDGWKICRNWSREITVVEFEGWIADHLVMEFILRFV